MSFRIINADSIKRRAYWVTEIAKIGDHFGTDSARVQQEVTLEISEQGTSALHDHLRLCGAIPEEYGHDSTEEKLYSKYTDILLHLAFRSLGLNSTVLTERGDAADVEVLAGQFSFVADAKAFRLSRTAKNQKDFKVQAMHGWKRGKPHALVVCPLYQLPARTSLIYQQAIAHNVCIFSYSHLCVLVAVADVLSEARAEDLLLKIFRCFDSLIPAKDAGVYWTTLNRCMLDYADEVRALWEIEKLALLDSIVAARDESLTALAREREAIMRLNRDEAITRLIDVHRINSRENQIRRVADNLLLTLS